MADSISLLTSINGTLVNILRTISPQNETERTQQTVLRESRGGLDPSNINPPKPKANAQTLTINGGDIKISDLVTALNGIPEPVKEIAGLKSGVIKDFSDVLAAIADGMTGMTKKVSNPNSLKDSAEFLKSLAGVSESVKSIAKLSFILPFALTGAKLLTPFFKELAKSTDVEINEKSAKALTEMLKSLNNISTVVTRIAVIWPVMPFATLGAKSLKPFFKTLASAMDIEITESNVKSITALSGLVDTVIKLTTKDFKISKSDIDKVKRLRPFFTELAKSVSEIDITESDAKKIEQLTNAFSKIDVIIKNTIKVVPILPIAILGAKMLKPFIKSLASSVDVTLTEEQMNNVSNLIDTMAKIDKLVGKTALITPVMPVALLGAAMIKPYFKLLGSMCAYVGGLDNIEKGIENVKKMETFTNTVIKFAAAGILLSGATLGLGIIMKDNFVVMLKGLGAVATVLTGYTLVAAIAGFAGKKVQAEQVWINTIIKFAAAGIGLTVATAALGLVADQYQVPVFDGLKFVTATLIGYTAVAALASFAGKYVQAESGWFNTIVKFAGFGMGLVLASAVIGGVVEKVWDKVLIGMGSIAGTILLVAGISAILSFVKTPTINGVKDMMYVELFMLSAAGLVFGAAVLGGVVEKVWDKVLIGTGSMTMMFGIIVGIAATINAITVPTKTAIKNMLLVEGLFASSAALIIVGAIMGGVVEKVWDKVLIGTGSMTAMMGIVIGLSAAINAASVPSETAIKNIAFVEGVIAGSIGILTAIIGVDVLRKTANVSWKDIAITVGAMTAITGLTMGLAYAINKAGAPSNTAIKNMALVEAVVTGTLGILTGIIGIDILKRKSGIEWTEIFATIGAMDTIIASVGLLAFTAGKLKGLKQGAISLLLIDAVAAGAAGVLAGIIGIQVLKNENNVDWSDIFITLGAMSSILVAIGGIAIAAGALVEFIAPGVLALAGVELIAAGSGLVLSQVLDLVKKKNDNGIEWSDVFVTLDAISTMITGVGAIAAAAGAVFPFIALGELALAGIIGITSMSVNVADKVFELQKNLNDNGLDTAALAQTLRGVTGLFTKENLDFKLSLKDIAVLDAKYLAIIPVMGSLSLATTTISKMVDSLGGMDDNGNIRPVLSVDKDGKAVYGNPVNVQKVTKIVTDSLSYFAQQMSDTFKNLDVMPAVRLNIAMKTLKNMIDPVSKFAEMLSSFESAGNGKIRVIKYDKDGKLINTPLVDIKSVAKIIADSISVFGKTLFSKSNIDGWMKNITQTDSKWPFAKSDAEKAMGILGKIITPVSNFAETLSMFESAGNGTLIVNEYDSNGKITSTRNIVIANVAESIANAVTTFARILFVDHADEWSQISGGNKGKILGIFGKNNNEKAVGIFATIIDPVNNFVNMLTQFVGENGELGIVDESGKVTKIKITDIATTIATSITTFVTKLTNAFSDKDILEKFNNNTSAILDALNSFGTSINSIKPVNGKTLDGNADAVRQYIEKLTGMTGTDLSSLTEFTTKLYEFNTELGKLGISKDTRKLIENNVDLIEDILKAFKPIFKYDWSVLHTASENMADVINEIQSLGTVKFTFVDEFGNMTDKIVTAFEQFDDIKWKNIDNMTSNVSAYIKAFQEIKNFDMDSFTAFIGAMNQLKNFDNTSVITVFTGLDGSIKNFSVSLNDTTTKMQSMFSSLDGSIADFAVSIDKTVNSISTFGTIVGTAEQYVIKLHSALNDINIILSKIEYPTESDLLSIEQLTKNVAGMIQTVSDTASAERTKKVNNFKNAINATSSGMKAFDKVMENGKNNRKSNLESFATALDGLKTKLDGLSENLTTLKETVQVVSNADAGRIQETANALGKLAGSTSGGTGSGSGSSISYDNLVNAIKDALRGISVETSVTQDTGAPAHTTSGDRVADAIIEAISEMRNQNIGISTTLNVSN